jgi:hypothetical protein
MSVIASRSRNYYPALASTYSKVWRRTTTFAYDTSALIASSGVNAYTTRHAKSGYVVFGRAPSVSASAFAAACAYIRSQNPLCRMLHYVIQTEVGPSYQEIAAVANQAAMLVSGATVDEVTKRTDTGTFWRCTALPSSVLGNWSETAGFPAYPEPGHTYEGVTRQGKLSTMGAWYLKNNAANGGHNTWDFVDYNPNLNHGTSSPTVDSSDRSLQEWLAEWYYHPTNGLHMASGIGQYIDGIWMDNCKVYARAGADINNTGSQDAYAAPPGAARKTWSTRGHARFIRALRRIRPTALIHGNSESGNGPALDDSVVNDFYNDPDLQSLDGGMYEFAAGFSGGGMAGTAGKTLHGEGWAKLLSRYNLICSKCTKQKAVAMTVYLSSATAYQEARIAICTALLGDGTATVLTGSGYNPTPPEFDEYEQQLGAPIEPAPSVKVTGTTNIWSRKYQNGIVVVNGASAGAGPYTPGTAETVDTDVLPYGIYKRFLGTQDPAVNDGTVVNSSFSLAGWDGRILLCVTPGVHS